jgi:hypothetical protein
MDKCSCLIPDENDNCIDCGKHIDLSYLDDEPLPNLGDIVGICGLIDKTAKMYATVIRKNTDPANPSLPRLRIVGNRIIRLSHKTLLFELMKPTFKEAKALGYKGNLERWGELVEERMTPSAPPQI